MKTLHRRDLTQLETIFKNKLILFCLILLIFCVIYFPAIFMYYAHHDDLSYFEREPGLFTRHPFQDLNFAIGRFTGALFETFLSWCVYSVNDLKFIRFLSIVQFSMCVFGGIVFAQNHRFNAFYAFLLLISLFTLPPFQVFVSYAGVVCYIPAIVLSFFAALTATKVTFDQGFINSFKNKYALLSLILLFFAITTYPSAAMFYWSVAFGIFLIGITKKDKTLTQQIYIHLAIGLSATGMYALILMSVRRFLIGGTGGIYNPYVITSNYPEKLSWFIQSPLVQALNLWNIFPNLQHAYSVGAFIIVSIFIFLLRCRLERKINPGLVFISVAMLLFLFLLLSFLPNLVAVANIMWYRCCVGLTSLIFILLVWSGYQWILFFPVKYRQIVTAGLLMFLMLYSFARAYDTVFYYRARPSHMELEYIKTVVKRQQNTDYSLIHIIKPDPKDLKIRYDEFGILSISFDINISAIIKCAYRELGREGFLYKNNISYSSSEANGEYPKGDNVLLIDMPALVQSRIFRGEN